LHPNDFQFNCEDLSLRAAGYGIKGRRIKAVDPELVTSTVSEIAGEIRKTGEPYILQTDTYRLAGHAAYDTAEYVPEEELNRWKGEDPVPLTRNLLIDVVGLQKVESLETEVDEYGAGEINRALQAPKIDVSTVGWRHTANPMILQNFLKKSFTR